MRNVIIADDHPVTLNGMKAFLQKLGYNVIGTFTHGITALNQALTLKPDFAILDLSMPGMTGLEVLEHLRKTNKTIRIIIYTMYHEKALFERAKSLDVNGYLLKDFAMEELEECMNTLQYKKQWFSPKLDTALILKDADSLQEKILSLSPAERKIVELIAQEKSSKEIAELLFIAEKTVENHRSNVVKKLGLPQKNNSLSTWAVANRERLIRQETR